MFCIFGIFSLFLQLSAFLGGLWSDDDDYNRCPYPPPLPPPPPPPPTKMCCKFGTTNLGMEYLQQGP